jgi:hypothetical protein
MADDEREEGLEGVGEPFPVANEYAYVRVRKVRTRNGERLELSSPKLARRILLDPVQLESLTWQTPESLSSLLIDQPSPEGAP